MKDNSNGITAHLPSAGQCLLSQIKQYGNPKANRIIFIFYSWLIIFFLPLMHGCFWLPLMHE